MICQEDNWSLSAKLLVFQSGLFKEPSFVTGSAKLFQLLLSAGAAREPSLITKDEGCPDDALCLHLSVKSLISYTWVAPNLLFALCTSGSKRDSSLSHMPSKSPCAIKGHAASPDSPGNGVGSVHKWTCWT